MVMEMKMDKKVEVLEFWANFLTLALAYDINKSLSSLIRKGY